MMRWRPFLHFLMFVPLAVLADRGEATAAAAPGEPPGRPQGFVWIKPGTMTVSEPATESDATGVKDVQTPSKIGRGLWMGQHQVTQAEYLELIGNNPSRFKGDLKRPVEMVSWFDATNYCGKVTERERAAGKLPSGYVYRLPTGAEWEYACRAGTAPPIGLANGSSSLPPIFNRNLPFVDPARNPDIEKTYAVAVDEPNAWGLHDMHGDVWEWCSDWYEEALSGGNAAGPREPATSTGLVVHGGSWYFYAKSWRSAFLDGCYPDRGYLNFGFRLVLAPGR